MYRNVGKMVISLTENRPFSQSENTVHQTPKRPKMVTSRTGTRPFHRSGETFSCTETSGKWSFRER